MQAHKTLLVSLETLNRQETSLRNRLAQVERESQELRLQVARSMFKEIKLMKIGVHS